MEDKENPLKDLVSTLIEQEAIKNEEKYAWEGSKERREREEQEDRERLALQDVSMADQIYAERSAQIRGEISYLQHMINIYDRSEYMGQQKITKDELIEKRDQLIKDLQNLPERLRINR